MTAVRRATAADLPAMVDVLVAAHADYEWERWLLPQGDRAARLRELVEVDLSLIGVPTGEAWVAAEGRDVHSVAVWLPPHARPDVTALARLDAVASAALSDRRGLVEAVEAAIEAHHPRRPHWFLATMGTSPALQRRGLGRAVLAPVLARLEALGVAACCDTSSTRNVAFYASVGFQPVAELADLPGGAPTTSVLWREPSAAASRPGASGR